MLNGGTVGVKISTGISVSILFVNAVFRRYFRQYAAVPLYEIDYWLDYWFHIMSCVVDKDTKKYFDYDDVLTSVSKMVKTTVTKG